MAKRILINIFILITICCISILNKAFDSQAAFSATSFENSAIISKGVMLQAYPAKTISTAALNEGDIVYFINPTDLWMEEVKVLPKNTYFRGYIEMLKMPIKGINAAIVIKITEGILPDGTIKKIKGTIVQNGKTQLGGDLTPPASYNKTVHPREGMYGKRAGVLQYVPSGEYEMGRHLTIPTSDIVYIMLDEDYNSMSDDIERFELYK